MWLRNKKTGGLFNTDNYKMTTTYNEDFKMYTISAKNGNTDIVEGTLDYQIINGEYHIRNTHVFEEFRNRGVGRKLARNLQNTAGDQDIYIDTIVRGSEGFWNKVAEKEVYKRSKSGVPYYKGRIK